MALTKVVNGVPVKMTEEEEKAFLIRQENNRIALENKKKEYLSGVQTKINTLRASGMNDACIRIIYPESIQVLGSE